MLRKLQEEQKVWSDKNFEPQPSYRMLLGAMEELGELSHAHLKAEQGIRTGEDHIAAKKDALGDIVTYLAAYCNSEGIDFESAVQDTWDRVKQRDWKNNPVTGVFTPVKRIIQVKYKGIDDWSRPIFKDISASNYFGSCNYLFPNRTIAPRNADIEIVTFFRENIGELEFFGNRFNCEPMGGMPDNVELQIVD